MEENKILQNCWKTWRDCLAGQDPHNVFDQISGMVWETAIYHFILASRTSQLRKYKSLPGFHYHMNRFIDRNYFSVQVAGIRRLTDKYPLRGKKGVFSLRALINDIHEKRNELTRRSFLSLQKLPYEYQSNSSQTFEISWDDVWDAHRRFDHLSGRKPQTRTPNDLISERIFTKLEEILDTCREIVTYVDKNIAHAATPESRQFENADEIRLTNKQIWNAHKNIFKVTMFLSGCLYGHGLVPLAWEPPDLFETSNIPVIDIGLDFESIFRNYREETEIWRLNDAEEFLNETAKEVQNYESVQPK
jgi:hypothetical protein